MRHNIISVLDSDGGTVNVSGVKQGDMAHLLVQSVTIESLLAELLAEIKIMNLHLQLITDEEIE